MSFDPELADRLRELIGSQEGVSERRMFGGVAFLVHGNMALSASGEGGLLLHVPVDATDELATRPNARVAVMRGREMRGWLRVDAGGVRTRQQLEKWVALGVAHARSLPAKG